MKYNYKYMITICLGLIVSLTGALTFNALCSSSLSLIESYPSKYSF